MTPKKRESNLMMIGQFLLNGIIMAIIFAYEIIANDGGDFSSEHPIIFAGQGVLAIWQALIIWKIVRTKNPKYRQRNEKARRVRQHERLQLDRKK